MKPAPFDYTLAETIEDAVQALADGDGEAIILAGGQTLMPMLNMRMARPERLVDINRVAALSGIEEGDGMLTIKACTRQADVLASDVVRQKVPLLTKAIAFVGHTQTRNRGTVGGSLAHADPAAEIPLASLAMDAEVTLQSVDGIRRIPVAEFFVGPLETARQENELLVALHYPVAAPEARVGTGFHEMNERHGDFAIVAAAARVELDAAGSCISIALALGGVDSCPMRMTAVEQGLLGTVMDDAAIQAAAQSIPDAIDPGDDQHGTAEYRRRVAVRLAARALGDALAEALNEDQGGAA